MLQAEATKHTLQFKQASGTSRGVLHAKNSWIISIWDSSAPHVKGTGEASIIENLSPDWNETYEDKLASVMLNCDQHFSKNLEDLIDLPSVRFALESALLDLRNNGCGIYFPSDFTQGITGIPINGLIWMGSREFMERQIREKIEQGYTCIKMKIGSLDFETELEILKSIRKLYPQKDLELRVDANGAFKPADALFKLEILAALDIHSIEQPIMAGQYEAMQRLCAETPLPIALDEDLIGIQTPEEKEKLIQLIRPQYIILKPSLLGGFQSCDEWIDAAGKTRTSWWITSALESNIGLNAIAQYTFTKQNPLPQGLGTGQLYTNNFPSALKISNGYLFLDAKSTR